MRPLSFIVKLIGVVLIILGFFFAVGFRFEHSIGILILGISFSAGGYSLFLVSKRMAARNYNEIARIDQRAPVLFLRSFITDKIGQKPIELSWWDGFFSSVIPDNQTTQDEQLESAFADFGPIKALARPGAWFNMTGIHTVQITNDRWQQEVLDTMQKAILIVFRVGNDSKGFQWEIKQVFELAAWSKIIFLLPRSQEEYNKFATFIEKEVGKKLPPFQVARYLNDYSGLLHFTQDGEPVIERAKSAAFGLAPNFFNVTAINLKTMLTSAYPQHANNLSFVQMPDRLKAFALDLILIIPISLVFTWIGIWIGWLAMNDWIWKAAIIASGLTFLIYPVATELIFTKGSWGKRRMNIHVADKVHIKPSLQQAFIRILFRLITFFPLGFLIVPYYIIAWWKNLPLLHDFLSRTRLFKYSIKTP